MSDSKRAIGEFRSPSSAAVMRHATRPAWMLEDWSLDDSAPRPALTTNRVLELVEHGGGSGDPYNAVGRKAMGRGSR